MGKKPYNSNFTGRPRMTPEQLAAKLAEIRAAKRVAREALQERREIERTYRYRPVYCPLCDEPHKQGDPC